MISIVIIVINNSYNGKNSNNSHNSISEQKKRNHDSLAVAAVGGKVALRVQVPNNHILS